jgi:hypothetical protein
MTTTIVEEKGLWTVKAHVDKYSPDQTSWVSKHLPHQRPQKKIFDLFGMTPEDGSAQDGNLLTTAGLTRLMSLLNGAGGQALTNTAVRLGTGNGGGTAAVGDTDLSAAAGSTNRWFQVMDATFPSVAANVLTARGTFASADGNYAWSEWGLDVGTPTVTSGNTVAALLFNHKTAAALGTKTAGSSWVLTVTITIT